MAPRLSGVRFKIDWQGVIALALNQMSQQRHAGSALIRFALLSWRRYDVLATACACKLLSAFDLDLDASRNEFNRLVIARTNKAELSAAA